MCTQNHRHALCPVLRGAVLRDQKRNKKCGTESRETNIASSVREANVPSVFVCVCVCVREREREREREAARSSHAWYVGEGISHYSQMHTTASAPWTRTLTYSPILLLIFSLSLFFLKKEWIRGARNGNTDAS